MTVVRVPRSFGARVISELNAVAMIAYVIECDGDSWVLRSFGRQGAMISGPTLESAKEPTFERVRQWAPCRIGAT